MAPAVPADPSLDDAAEPDFRAIFESLPGSLLLLGPDFRIVDASDAYLAITGAAREDIVDRDVFEVFPENQETHEADAQRNLRASLEWVREHRERDTMPLQRWDVARPDGTGFEERWWSPVNSPVLGPGGELRFVLHEVEEVTALVRLQQAGEDAERRVTRELVLRAHEVAEASRRLKEGNTELSELYERTKAIDDLKTEFLASASHELRTPLALVLGPVELLLGSPTLADEQRQALEVVARNAERLRDAVDRLFEASKFDAARVELRYLEVDVAEVVGRLRRQLSTDAEQHRIRWTVVCPDELRAELDLSLFERAIGNLVTNACRYTAAGGTVRLEVTELGPDWFGIEVADSGPGVPEDAVATVFERRSRPRGAAPRRFGGSGLELATARDVIELHGGSIEVDTAPEGGARFALRLPRRAPAGTTVGTVAEEAPPERMVPRVAVPTAEAVTSTSSSGPTGAARVLVIEDDVDMNRFVADALANEFEVVTAFDGEVGLVAARALRPDVVVCDVMLPGGDGVEVVRALRSSTSLERVPVLLLSALADESFRVEALRAGADDYVTKPFVVEELRARVHNLAVRERVLADARQATARVEGLLHTAPDGMLVVDADGRIVLANRQASQLLGQPQLALDLAPIEVLGVEMAGVLRAELRAGPPADAEARSSEYELTVTRGDGSEVPIDMRLTTASVDGRSLVTASLRDMTAQRASDAALRASEARAVAIAAFAESLPSAWDDPVGILDAVSAHVAEHLGDSCWILWLGEDGETLVPLAGRFQDPALGDDIRTLTAGRPYSVDIGPAGLAVRRDVPMLLGREEFEAAGAAMPEAYRRWIGRHPVVSAAYVPLRHRDGTTGVLLAHRYAPSAPYSTEEFAFIRTIATRGSLAFENARLHEQAEEARRTFHSAFNDAPAPVVICSLSPDSVGCFLEVNPSYCDLTGYTREELLTMRVDEVTHPDDTGVDDGWMRRVAAGESSNEEVDKRLRTKDGRMVWVRVRISAVRDAAGHLLHTVNHVEDVTAQIEAEERLTRLALHDPVTGVPNRLLLMDRLEHGLLELTRTPGMLALLYVDLDRFKQVNDSFGHAAGDVLLVEIAHRLAGVVRPPDTVARIGGDEFVVLCSDAGSESDVEHVARRIMRALAEPVLVNGYELTVSASVGIATATTGHEDPHELLREADTAMFRAKEDGRARFQVYRDAFRSDALERLELEGELRTAIAAGGLRVEYQPIIDLRDGSTHAVEALVRFDHPTLGVLGPDQFIPLAEETGLIVPLGRWVLAQACEFQPRLRRATGRDLQISVNMSVRELDASDMADAIASIIAGSGVDPERLCLEMTESMYMEVARSAVKALGGLTDAGVQVAIDDFGTGYSSLVTLQRFPANTLKIDRSFVTGLGRSTEDTAIVTGTVLLAHGLDLAVVAEGVETAEQHEAVVRLGADFAQGFYYAASLSPDDLCDFLLEAGE